MTTDHVTNAVEIDIHKLPYMEDLYKQVIHEVDNLQCLSQELINHIEALKYKLSILDKTALSVEQERKRIEQQLQELIDKKDRLEKWIANISNNEELKQIVKENVKAVLSDNKIVISTAFAALILTLKTDPQMVKLIQNIPSANNGEQYKDNNNIVKYFELNKDRILNLCEKHYENLVEALTENAIDAVAASSSLNPTLSLPQQSSSRFQNLSNKSDIYRIEESESFHHSNEDIAD